MTEGTLRNYGADAEAGVPFLLTIMRTVWTNQIGRSVAGALR